MSGLTDRQREILKYIETHIRAKYPPVREIAKELKLSPTTVQEHINALRQKGKLK